MMLTFVIGDIVYFNYNIHWLSAAKILNMSRDTNKHGCRTGKEQVGLGGKYN
jgi:hypothetical protein